MKRFVFAACTLALSAMLCACTPVGTVAPDEDTQNQEVTAAHMKLADTVTLEDINRANLPLNVMKRHESMAVLMTYTDEGGQTVQTDSVWVGLDGNELAFLSHSFGEVNQTVNMLQGAAFLQDADNGDECYSVIYPYESFNDTVQQMLTSQDEFTKTSAEVSDGLLIYKGSMEDVEDQTLYLTLWTDPEHLIIQKQLFELKKPDGTISTKIEYNVNYDVLPDETMLSPMNKILTKNDCATITVVDDPENEYARTRTYTFAKGTKLMVGDIYDKYGAYTDPECKDEINSAIIADKDMTIYFAVK